MSQNSNKINKAVRVKAKVADTLSSEMNVQLPEFDAAAKKAFEAYNKALGGKNNIVPFSRKKKPEATDQAEESKPEYNSGLFVSPENQDPNYSKNPKLQNQSKTPSRPGAGQIQKEPDSNETQSDQSEQNTNQNDVPKESEAKNKDQQNTADSQNPQEAGENQPQAADSQSGEKAGSTQPKKPTNFPGKQMLNKAGDATKKAAGEAAKATGQAVTRLAVSAISGLATLLAPLLPFIGLFILFVIIITYISPISIFAYCFPDNPGANPKLVNVLGVGPTMRNLSEIIWSGDISPVNVAKITTLNSVDSEWGKMISKACGVNINCGPTTANTGTTLGAPICLDQQLIGKSETDTITLFSSNAGIVKQTGVPVRIIREVINAGKQAGVSSTTTAFVLSVVATEANVANPWGIIGGSGNDFYGIAQVGGVERTTWGGQIGGYKGDAFFLNNPSYQMQIIEVGLKEKISFGCAPGTNSEIYEGAYAWLTCAGVDGFGTTSVAYAEAAEKNYNIVTCQTKTTFNNTETNTSPLAFNPFQFFGPVKAFAATIPPAKITQLEALESSGKLTYQVESGSSQAKTGKIEEITVDFLIALGNRYDEVNITSLRRSKGDGSSHDVGLAVDIGAVSIGGKSIAPEDVWKRGANEQIPDLVSFAGGLADTGAIYLLITHSKLLPEILKNPKFVKVSSETEAFAQAASGKVGTYADDEGHNDHYHVSLKDSGTVNAIGTSGTSTANNCVCTNGSVTPTSASPLAFNPLQFFDPVKTYAATGDDAQLRAQLVSKVNSNNPIATYSTSPGEVASDINTYDINLVKLILFLSEKYPGLAINDLYRPGGSTFHGAGQAVDIGGWVAGKSNGPEDYTTQETVNFINTAKSTGVIVEIGVPPEIFSQVQSAGASGTFSDGPGHLHFAVAKSTEKTFDSSGSSLTGGNTTTAANCVCPDSSVKPTSGAVSTPDQYVAAVVSILEGKGLQGWLDVAQVIANRVSNNYGGYGANVRDQAFHPSQFAVTDGIAKAAIQDEQTAIAAIVSKTGQGYTAATAKTALDQFIAATRDAAKTRISEDFINNRVDFRAPAGALRPGEVQRDPTQNYFFIQNSGTTYRKSTISFIFGSAPVATATPRVQASFQGYNYNNLLANVLGGIQAQAQSTTPPANYAALTSEHLAFLDEVAKAKGYTKITDRRSEDPGMRAAFNAMRLQAQTDSINMQIVSGYRSNDDQVETYFEGGDSSLESNKITEFWAPGMNAAVTARVKAGYVARGIASAPPGYSEHHSGQAIDVQLVGLTDLNNATFPSNLYNWLNTNASNFGFVQSYKAGSTVGAGEEKWHWRWDGTQITDPTNNRFPNSNPIGSGTPAATSTTCTVNNGTVNGVGSQTLLEYAKAATVGKSPGGVCYRLVSDYIDAVGFGKIGGPNQPNMAAILAETGTDPTYPIDFAAMLNSNGNAARYGLRNLLATNPNLSPYDAPPGSVIIVTPGSPGTSDPDAGDITVKGNGDTFYNDGVMNYEGRASWNGSQGVSGGRVLGIYVPL